MALLVSAVPLYSADPVAYASLGAQDLLSVYNPTSRSVTQRTSIAQNGTAFALSPDGLTAYIGSLGVRAVTLGGETLWQDGATDVGAVSVSPDESQVYSVGVGYTLHIYNAQTGQLLSNVALNTTPSQVAATPGHAQIYVSGLEGVDVVDGTTYALKTTVHIQGNSGIAVTPDGSKVYVSATNSGKNLAYVIDTASNQVVATIPGNGYGAVGQVVLSSDGSIAYFATSAGLVEVETSTNAVIGMIASPDISVGHSLATDGQYAYYALGVPGLTPDFIQFNLPALNYTRVALGGTAIAVRYSTGAHAVLILETLDTVKTLDPVSGKKISDLGVINGTYNLSVSGSGNAVTGVAGVSTPTQLLEQISVIGAFTHQARQFEVPMGGGGGAFVANAIASLGFLVTSTAGASMPYVISVVDLTTGSVTRTVTVPQLSMAYSAYLAIAPDGSALYAGGGQSPASVCKISLPAFTTLVCVTVPGEVSGSINGRTLAVSSDGTKLYISFAGYGVVEYDTAALTVTRSMQGAAESAGAQELIYSAATNSVYISYTLVVNQTQYQSSVSRIDLGSFTIAATQNASFTPSDIAISPDGAELLVAGGPSGTLVLNGTTLAPEKIISTGLTQSVAVATH